jgi:hypothetical protein
MDHVSQGHHIEHTKSSNGLGSGCELPFVQFGGP